MPLRQKKLLKFVLKNQDLKKALFYGGGLFIVYRRHGLYSGGLLCMVEALTA